MTNRTISAFRQIGPKLVAQGIVLIALLAAIGYLANAAGFEDVLKSYSFSDDPSADWLHGRAAFLVVGAVLTAVGMPRQAVSFFAAYFFGLWPGFVLALAASGAGAAVGYGFARLYSSFAERAISGRVNVARQIWAANAFVLTVIIRLLPVGSNLLANLAAGAGSIPFLRFIGGSVTGYVPQTLVFALLGAGVNVGSREQVALSVLLFVASAALGLWIYANYRKRLRSASPEGANGTD